MTPNNNPNIPIQPSNNYGGPNQSIPIPATTAPTTTPKAPPSTETRPAAPVCVADGAGVEDGGVINGVEEAELNEGVQLITAEEDGETEAEEEDGIGELEMRGDEDVMLDEVDEVEVVVGVWGVAYSTVTVFVDCCWVRAGDARPRRAIEVGRRVERCILVL